MRTLRRITTLIAIVIAVAILAVQWILPVELSLETKHKPPQNAWLIPRELADHSVAQAASTKLSYFGYEFEVPWTDIDMSKTKSYPDSALLTFHSGLVLLVGSSTQSAPSDPRGKSPIALATVRDKFGTRSDYEFIASIYDFTPAEVHAWAVSPRVHYRETLMLNLKSVNLGPEAETGFFKVNNSTLNGFQQGDPQGWPSKYRPRCRSTVILQLFSDAGELNITLFQKDFHNPAGISQAEINRIIQSARSIGPLAASDSH